MDSASQTNVRVVSQQSSAEDATDGFTDTFKLAENAFSFAFGALARGRYRDADHPQATGDGLVP